MIGEGAHLHTEADGPNGYRISMPNRGAEALGLNGDTGRGERMISVKLGEPVTVLEPVTRGPQWTTVTIRVGSSRPYASTDQAAADLTWAREAYQAMLRASGGFLAGSEEGLPAAVALVDAWQALPDEHVADVPQELAAACTAWADAAGQLAAAPDLDRGDTFRAALDETVGRARLLAGRMTATAAAGGFPGVQLPVSLDPPEQDASAAPAGLPAMLDALAATGNLIIAHIGAPDRQAAEASPPGSAEPSVPPAAAPASPAGDDPAADQAAEADRPFPLLTRLRQIDGGAIITDPQAPDGFRQASPDGTVVAYPRPGWMAVLFDDAMQRESDRYCEILIADALRFYRRIGAANALSAHDLALLAEHLTPAQISELPAPGPADTAQAPADPAAHSAANLASTPAAGPEPAAIVITQCGDNTWDITVGGAAGGNLSWVGGPDGTVGPTTNELLLFNADSQRIASLYPSGGALPAAITEGDYRVCLAGSGREIAPHAPLEDAVREALAAAGDTKDQAAPGVAATATEPEPPADQTAQPPGPDSAAAASEPSLTSGAAPNAATQPGADGGDGGDGEQNTGPAAGSELAAAAQAPAIPAQDTLAGRITIDVSRAKPVVSGTDYERDPPELRQALREHFTWRKPKHHWEHKGPPRQAARHVTAIRETIARLDAEAAAARPPAAIQALKPLTGQQQEISDAAVAGDHLLIQALAGTGKTTTLTAAAAAIAAARPDDSMVYTSFTKSVILDASKGRFGPNVAVSTMHALARRALVLTSYAAKLENGPKGAAKADQWARVLGIPDQPDAYGVPADRGSVQAIADGVPADAESVAAMVMATVKKFRDSDAREPTTRHLPPELATHPGSPLARAVVDYARKAWANISDPGNAALCAAGGALQVSFDDYLKVWALSGPRIDAQVIMFDEAQDVNACMREVILQQADHAQLIFVGDSQQSIYAFRGAQDSLPIMAQRFPAARQLPLTQSWRFGQALAEFANLYLQLLGSPLRLQGNPGLETVIGPVEVPDAIICRTNATAVAEAVTAIDSGKRVAFASDRGNDMIAFARAARDLKNGRRTKHPDLAQFRDWDEVTECAYSGDEAYKHLQTFVRLIKDHGADDLIALLGRLVSEKEPHDITIGTVHQAKGLEWDRVRIAGDFKGPAEDPATGEIVMPSGEALRGMYVAVTRARKNLDPGPLSWVLGYATPPAAAAPQPVAEPAQAAAAQAAEPARRDEVVVNLATWSPPEPIPDGWLIVNAPRPIGGEITWEGEFRHGMYWAAAPADTADRAGWEALDAWPVRFVTDNEIAAEVIRYLADNGYPSAEAAGTTNEERARVTAEAAGTTIEELARDLDLPWAGQTRQEAANAAEAAPGTAAPDEPVPLAGPDPADAPAEPQDGLFHAGTGTPASGQSPASTGADTPPDGTQPLTGHQPWGGTLRPERLVYPDGTPLTVYGQGEDGDETWQATAAGAVPAPQDSEQGPGLLQIARRDETGEYAIIHPALTCPAGVDRHSGLSDQDRARWEAFDAAEAWPNRVAWIPARLVKQGDTIQDERGPQSRTSDMREIEAAAPVGEGIEVKVSGIRKPRQYPADHLIGVFIPEEHPTLARMTQAATGNPNPDQPPADALAAGAADIPEPPSAAADPDAGAEAAAASEASPPGTAAPAVSGTSEDQADGRAGEATGQAEPEHEAGHAPEPLAGSDLAIAMRRMAPWEFADMILDRQTGAAGGGSATRRRESEPDAGASEHITRLGHGIQIRIGSPDQTREGKVTWAYVRTWLEPGLTPARRQLLTDANRVHSQYHILAELHSVHGTPVHQALEQAVAELHGLLEQVIDTIVSDALTEHGSDPLPRRAPSRPARPAGDDAQLPLLGEQGGSPAEAAALERVAQLATVIPPWPPRWSKPTSEIEPDDVLVHPGIGSGPFLVTAAPRRTGDTTEIDGRANYGGHDERPTTLRLSHEKHPDPDIEIIPADGPLTGPIPQLSPAPDAVVAKAAASAPAASQAGPPQAGEAPGPGGGPPTEPGQVPETTPAAAPAGTPGGTAGQDSEAAQLAAAAGTVSRARAAAHVPIDYARMKTVNRRLRAALTRAVNSGDPEKVILAARNALREWSQPGAAWPDYWSDWQRALDDVLPWNKRILLDDLAAADELISAATAPDPVQGSLLPEADAAKASGLPAGADPAGPADEHETRPAPAAAAEPAPAADEQEPAGTGQPAGDIDGRHDAPQDLVLAATPGQEGQVPAGAAGRRVLEHVQGPAGQTWVRDDEGTIWAWPPTGGALVIVTDPQTASDTAGPPELAQPATASPVPGHIRALAGRLIGRGGVTVRIDPPMSSDYRDWAIAFVRGYGEEVWLTVPGDLPATVTLATLHRFEISRGSRVSTGQDVLPVTPGQSATDGQLDDWLQPTSAPPAPAPLPGQAARPEDTHPLTQDAPWNGPIHPDLTVYRDGTMLTVRFQGPDADQTWHGTAAGIVPGDGPYEPGLLQVVAWEFETGGETRRYSTVHPVLTSTLTDNPYQGLDPRQRERWRLFDQAVAAGRTTADLPGRLLDPGDAVESPHPATASWVITVRSATPAPDGKTKVEGASEHSPAVTSYEPPGKLFATRIPATRPSAARTGADEQAATPAEDDKAQTPAGPQPGTGGQEPATADAAPSTASQEPAGSSPGPTGAEPPDGTQPLASHQPWQGQRRPERLVYAGGTRLTVRVPRSPDPPALLSGTRAAVAAGVSRAADGGLMQVVRWEDGGGYAVAHPAVTWPAGTDPYQGLDERRRRRWEAFDAAEASPYYKDGDPANLPSSLTEPGDHVILYVRGQPRVAEVDRLQPVTGDPGHREIVFKGRQSPLEESDGLIIPVQIPRIHPALAAAITAITRPPAPGAAAAPDRGRPADLHRYTRLIHSQRERLQAAVAAGDRNQVVTACRDAVIAWNRPRNIWPPDADQWQAALDRFLPDLDDVDFADDPRIILEDLAEEPAPHEPDEPDEPDALFDIGPLSETTRSAPAAPAQQAPAAAPEPAGPAPITNADAAAAWQHIAADSSGRAWAVVEFITQGTVPAPASVHCPDDPQDTTSWDGDGLRRTVGSAQPPRDGTLTWDQAARWINAGMTPGDLRILLQASRVARFCDAWLERVRGTADEDEADAFYDAGRGATAIVQDCISRVTTAAAQAHGPDAPVPAAPASADSYRRERVTTTAEQARDLAAISELSDFAHRAAHRVERSAPGQPDTTSATADVTSPGTPAGHATAGPGASAPSADVKATRPADVDAGQAGPTSGGQPEPAAPAPITNADVAAAWLHIAASSSAAAWSVAEFVTHGTAPGPGSLTGPDAPQDTTAWDRDGLRRTVTSGQPPRDGTLTWDQATRWINAGMTSGDLQILLHAGRVIAFSNAWLEQVRGTEGQETAFSDAGQRAAAIVRDCIARVTAAAAQAHQPDAPAATGLPAADDYRRQQVTTTAEQDEILAAISQLSTLAHQAARHVTGGSAGPLTTAQIRAAIKQVIGNSLPDYVRAATGPQPMRDLATRISSGHHDQAQTFTTEQDPAGQQATHGQIQVTEAGLIISHRGGGDSQHAIAWEELPPWILGALDATQRAELVAVARRAVRDPAAATAEPARQVIDHAWATILAAPPPANADIASARTRYSTRPAPQDDLFATAGTILPPAGTGIADAQPGDRAAHPAGATAEPAEPAHDRPDTRPAPEAPPPCPYDSAARGLAARLAEWNASLADHGSGPAARHAWRVNLTCPDTPTEQCQPTILTADLRRRNAKDPRRPAATTARCCTGPAAAAPAATGKAPSGTTRMPPRRMAATTPGPAGATCRPHPSPPASRPGPLRPIRLRSPGGPAGSTPSTRQDG